MAPLSYSPALGHLVLSPLLPGPAAYRLLAAQRQALGVVAICKDRERERETDRDKRGMVAPTAAAEQDGEAQ